MTAKRTIVILAIAAMVWMLSLLAGCPVGDGTQGRTEVSAKQTGVVGEGANQVPTATEEAALPATELVSQLIMVKGLAESASAKEIVTAIEGIDGVEACQAVENEDALLVEHYPAKASVPTLLAAIEGFGLTGTAPSAAGGEAAPATAQGECSGECDGECDGSCPEGECKGTCTEEKKAEAGCAGGEGAAEECGSCAAPDGVMPETAPEGKTRVKFSVENLTCNGKAGYLVKMMTEMKGVAGAYPDVATKTLVVDYDAALVKVEAMIAAMDATEVFKAKVIQ